MKVKELWTVRCTGHLVDQCHYLSAKAKVIICHSRQFLRFLRMLPILSPLGLAKSR